MFEFRRSQAEPDFGPTLQLPHLQRSIFLKLTNGTNKMVCQSLATLSSQLLCSTLAYFVSFEKMGSSVTEHLAGKALLS